MRQTSRLAEGYFAGGRDEARRSTEEANRLVESAKLLPQYQEGQAFTLFLGYARLYALERRAGSNDVAEAAITKARYWCLRSAELHGDTPVECIAYVDEFADEEKLMAFIDKWDKNANHGDEPKYIHQP
jgi:hypothetical protein